jgi:hypothetical protein
VIAIGLTHAPAPVDATAVAAVAKAEVKAGRLRLDAKTCLGIGNGSDPEDVLLRDLRRSGLAFRKAHRCNANPPSGMELDLTRIEPAGEAGLTIDVTLVNLTLEPGSHFATLLSRGTYTLAKDTSGWSVATYESRSLEEPVASDQIGSFPMYELYSWPDTKDGWHFCLAPNTSMLKRARRLLDPRHTIRGVEALQRLIPTLAGTTEIVWLDHLQVGGGPKEPGSELFRLPPEDIIMRVRQTTERHHLTLTVAHVFP